MAPLTAVDETTRVFGELSFALVDGGTEFIFCPSVSML